MLLDQLHTLMADAAGDAELIKDSQRKLAELDAARRRVAELEAALGAQTERAEIAERRLGSVAQDAEAAARAIGDQMLREKAAKDCAHSALQTAAGEAETRGSEVSGLRAANERLGLENERLRSEVVEGRERAHASEARASEATKLLHVMRAEHASDQRERRDLEAKVNALGETVDRVRRAENDAAAARCALDTEVAALSHAIGSSATRGPPLAPMPAPRAVPPMPMNKLPPPYDAAGSLQARAPLGSGRATPRSARGGGAYGRQQ